MSTGKAETVQLMVSVAPSAPEPKKPDVGFKVTRTEKVVVETKAIMALSEETYDFIHARGGHEWVAPNGLILKAHPQYITKFVPNGDNVPVFYLDTDDFRGKRCDLWSKFESNALFVANIDKLAEALKALAVAVTSAQQPEVSLFDGLDVF